MDERKSVKKYRRVQRMADIFLLLTLTIFAIIIHSKGGSVIEVIPFFFLVILGTVLLIEKKLTTVSDIYIDDEKVTFYRYNGKKEFILAKDIVTIRRKKDDCFFIELQNGKKLIADLSDHHGANFMVHCKGNVDDQIKRHHFPAVEFVDELGNRKESIAEKEPDRGEAWKKDTSDENSNVGRLRETLKGLKVAFICGGLLSFVFHEYLSGIIWLVFSLGLVALFGYSFTEVNIHDGKVTFTHLNRNCMAVNQTAVKKIIVIWSSLYILILEKNLPQYVYQSPTYKAKVQNGEDIHYSILQTDFPDAEYMTLWEKEI